MYVFDLSAIKIIIKMEDRNLIEEVPFCKNHPQLPSGYFLTDQPWIKYCKNCALNVALCGRKIQKQLNQEQFDRKMQISSIVTEMKTSLEQIESTSDYYKRLIDVLEDTSNPLSVHIRAVDNTLKELTNTKQKLQTIYLQEISQKIHHYFQKQSKITFLSMQIKKEVQSIESNYSNLIEMKQSDDFNTSKEKWDQLLENNRRELLLEQDFNQYKQKITKSIDQFYNQLEVFNKFTFDIKIDRMFKLTTNDQFDITLTPIQGNSLNNSLTFNLKPKAPLLKLKTNRKITTERDSLNTSKILTSKRPSGVQNNYENVTKRPFYQ